MKKAKENTSLKEIQTENIETRENKKEYKTPTLTQFGNVSELVQANTVNGADGGGTTSLTAS